MSVAPAATGKPNRVNRRLTFVRWVRKTHGWFGLWGALLGLLMAFMSVTLRTNQIIGRFNQEGKASTQQETQYRSKWEPQPPLAEQRQQPTINPPAIMFLRPDSHTPKPPPVTERQQRRRV